MLADYQPFIDRVIDRYEGGYGWDAKDPGGPTKYGITCYDLAEHRGQTMTSMSTWAPLVKAMSRQEAEDIYRSKYATGVQFDYLNPGCDTVLLDYGINSGESRLIRVARALLKLPAGATMTPDLVAAINKADAKWFINAVCTERLHFMHRSAAGRHGLEFGRGWGARVADLQIYSEISAGQRPRRAGSLSAGTEGEPYRSTSGHQVDQRHSGRWRRGWHGSACFWPTTFGRGRRCCRRDCFWRSLCNL